MKKYIIVGGGIAGFSAALTLKNSLKNIPIDITLLNLPVADAIADTGYATLRHFHQILGLSEQEFLRATGSGLCLANCYEGWQGKEDGFYHSLAPLNILFNHIELHHYVTLLQQCGDLRGYSEYSLSVQLAKQNKVLINDDGCISQELHHGYQIEISPYKNLLQQLVQAAGVSVIDAKNVAVTLDVNSGAIAHVLIDGNALAGDFYIDASGESAVLMSAIDCTKPTSWQNNFLVDSMIEHTQDCSELSPSIKIQALANGWLKTYLLCGKKITQYVYSQALSLAADNAVIAEQLATKGATKRELCAQVRSRFWYKNCLAIGNAAVQLPPLAVSHLHIMNSAILRFIERLPQHDASDQLLADDYNRITHDELLRVKDIEQAHLQLHSPLQGAFWYAAQQAPISDELRHKIAVFSLQGNLAFYEQETWLKGLWVAFFMGFSVVPERYDPQLNGFNVDYIAKAMQSILLQQQGVITNAHNYADFMQQQPLVRI